MSALRFVGALPEHFPLCPLTPRPICTPMSGSNARPWLVYSGSSLMPSSDDDVSNLLDRSTMTLTGVVLQSFQRRWDYERQSCGQWLDALSEKWYILDAWGPRGSRADRASSRTLVAPVRAVLARPCGPSDALLGPLGRAIVPGPLGFVCGWWGRVMCLREILVVRYASARFHFGYFVLIPVQPDGRAHGTLHKALVTKYMTWVWGEVLCASACICSLTRDGFISLSKHFGWGQTPPRTQECGIDMHNMYMYLNIGIGLLSTTRASKERSPVLAPGP